jgi:hypothetical protein
MKKIGIQVRSRTIWHVTRWEWESHDDGTNSGGSQSFGEFDNPSAANEVATALHSLSKSHVSVRDMLELSLASVPAPSIT